MFLNKTIERNSALVEAAIHFHQSGALLPDTYVVDLDTLLLNSEKIKRVADQNNVRLYFMLKQLGRNPMIAQRLMEVGFDGAVAVDFREALSMIDAGVKIGNVGHLVQVPKASLRRILEAKPEYITVYSMEKIREINEICHELHMTQKLMTRVVESSDILYSGQYGGFALNELQDAVVQVQRLDSVEITGLTSFPCFLFNDAAGKIEPTHNIATLQKAKTILDGIGIGIEQMNMPSATCCDSIPQIHRFGGTHGEPGHGLTGTTPLHAVENCGEIPCLVYLSEISHNCDGRAYCFGGGHYRRSHVEKALVGPLEGGRLLDVIPPTDESIDYYFGLSNTAQVSQSVVMAFRFQIFTTRSEVALVKGISSGSPEIVGIFTALGQQLL